MSDTNAESVGTSDDGEVEVLDAEIEIREICHMRTDFSQNGYQKAVKFSPDGAFLATAGVDGTVRIWGYEDSALSADSWERARRSFTELHVIHAHQSDVDDVSFSPDSKHLVSACRDRHNYVWDVRRGVQLTELVCSGQSSSRIKYAIKRLRFTHLMTKEKSGKVVVLFTIANPVAIAGPGAGSGNSRSSTAPSLLQRWDGHSFVVQQMRNFAASRCGLSSIAVSRSSMSGGLLRCSYVAVSSMEGGIVDVVSATTLDIVHTVSQCHASFITGLEFVGQLTEEGDSGDSQLVADASDLFFSRCSVASISVDNVVTVVTVPMMAGREASGVASRCGSCFALAVAGLISFVAAYAAITFART